MSRVTLHLLYPGSLKAVHLLPAVFVLGCVTLLALGTLVSAWFLLPLALYFLTVAIGALISTRRPAIALRAVPAAAIQLGGYGLGFINAFFVKIVLGRGRDIEEEIKLRKGR